MSITSILIYILIFVISFVLFSLPLFLGLILMGRPQGIIKVGIINFIAILMNVGIILLFGGFLAGLGIIGLIIPFFLTILLYRESFKIKWWRAFFVLVLQYVLGIIIYFSLAALGIGILALDWTIGIF